MSKNKVIQQIWDRFDNGTDTQADIQYLFNYIYQLEHIVNDYDKLVSNVNELYTTVKRLKESIHE